MRLAAQGLTASRACMLGLLVAFALVIGLPAGAALAEPPSPPPSAATSAAAAPAPDDIPIMDTWPTDTAPMTMERPKTFSGRLQMWLGMWHPAVIHFPIALVLTVAFLELAAVIRRKPIYAASTKLLLAVAVAGAIIAAPLGWLNAGMPAADDSLTLTAHRWLGTAMPLLLVGLWALKRPSEAAAVRLSSRGYELALAMTVMLILVQAYLGAEITHGAGHMAF